MKKFALLVVLLLCLMVVSVAAGDSLHPPICPPDCDGESVLIFPWRFETGEVVPLYTDQEIVLGARWGACKAGLVTRFLHAVELEWQLDGVPLFTSQEEVQQYWGPLATEPDLPVEQCIIPATEIWLSYWQYSLGEMAAGDYWLLFEYNLKQPVIDGIDSDGDGRPDVYEGTLQTADIVLKITER